MTPRAIPEPTIADIERFVSRIVIDIQGCWNWGIDQTSKYGQFSFKNKGTPAHRFLYRAFKSKMNQKKVLDHLCRNTKCVNPAHLEEVTTGENVLRGTGITAKNKAKVECRNGHAFSKENTYIHPKRQTRDCKTCRAASVARHNNKKERI